MEENQLMQLNLQLYIPDYWATRIADKFPGIQFRIHRSYPIGNNTRSGILELDRLSYKTVKDFLKRKGVSLEEFNPRQGYYYFTDSNCPLAEIVSAVPCLEMYPITLAKDRFDVKLQMPSQYVESTISLIKDKGLSIISLAKFRINFDVRDMLTPRQKEVLMQALVKGYYSFPKETCMNGLASSISLSPSTLCVHLQKIEHKIMNYYGSTF